MNIERLKKLYKHNLLNSSIVFNECKDYILDLISRGYNFNKILKLLEIELKEEGIDINLKTPTFYRWKKKNIDKKDKQ
jgi:hypothetical protein